MAEEIKEVDKEEPKVEPEKPQEDEIELPDGSKVSHKELISGYMKDADYRQKTATLAREREEVHALKSVANQNPMRSEPEADDPLKKYNPEQVAEFKRLASAVGFVDVNKLKEIEETKIKDQTLNNFWTQHPEYYQEHDPQGIKYGALKQELEMFNLSPRNLGKALEAAHKAVSQRWTTSEETAKAIAAKARVSAAGVGNSGNSSGEEIDVSKYSEAQLAVMKKMGLLD